MNWDFCWLYSDKFIKRSSSHKIYMKFVNLMKEKLSANLVTNTVESVSLCFHQT